MRAGLAAVVIEAEPNRHEAAHPDRDHPRQIREELRPLGVRREVAHQPGDKGIHADHHQDGHADGSDGDRSDDPRCPESCHVCEIPQ